MRHFLKIGVAITLVACSPLATRQEFDRQMDAVIGTNINNIMIKLGAPLQTYQMPNGSKMYTFILAQQRSRQPTVTTAKVDPEYGYGPITGSSVTTAATLDGVSPAKSGAHRGMPASARRVSACSRVS